MNKKLMIAIVASMFSSISFGADVYTALDADQNGTISKVEATALPELSKQWATLDSDTNGELTVEEFAQFETLDIPVPAKHDPANNAPVLDMIEDM
jgi:hypothetical protein